MYEVSGPYVGGLSVARANQVWVTDITYIRTRQGWLYLAVVIDLSSLTWSAGR